jgi:hypothetical protein
LLRLASVVICVIVIASFLVFAINQTKSASGRQQEVIQNGGPAQVASGGAGAKPAHKSAAHEAIDDASSKLTSPFSSIVSALSGEWAVRGANLFLALLVYGFGLGFLARTLRVRV